MCGSSYVVWFLEGLQLRQGGENSVRSVPRHAANDALQ